MNRRRGLDPIARIELRGQLKQLHAEGITILISSHILGDPSGRHFFGQSALIRQRAQCPGYRGELRHPVTGTASSGADLRD